ncbi:hypothetical protein BDZ94DRAFT_1300063 [Collybia nuda]|uniref:F-box domain-containing protein n=1 Tax=Collybia nuda TaxID=64659 RepID=A0A9P6CGP4_9AGAR|nr:hypothetical protein BDZ94DRAFT_1300063 [Collybia nuda]
MPSSPVTSTEVKSETQSQFMSKVSKIPNELLSEIFKLSTPKPITISPDLESDDLPWALFGICKKWRQIATGMPELWTNIIVEYEDDPSIPVANTSDPKFVTRVAHETLLRSGNAPLSLTVNSRKYNMDDQTPLINLVVLHAHRIKHLKLNLYEQALQKLVSLPPLDFKVLQFLSVWCYDGAEESISCAVFEKAPLVIAELNRYDWLPTQQGSPSAHLTHLSISIDFDLTPIKAHGILNQIPHLVFLQIPVSADEEPEERDRIPFITYPSLNTLIVNCSQPELLPEFFKPLILPCLNRLEITPSSWAPGVDNVDWGITSVLSKISSFPLLNIFAFTLPLPDNYDFNSYLLSIPKIVALELLTISESTLRLISSGDLLPNLQTLRVPVTSETIGIHWATVDDPADRHFKTQLIIYDHQLEKYLETNASEEEKKIIEELGDRELLELAPHRENYTRVEEFVPYDLKPSNDYET